MIIVKIEVQHPHGEIDIVETERLPTQTAAEAVRMIETTVARALTRAKSAIKAEN